MVGALDVVALRAREDRVAERLVVALDPEHPPAAEPAVAAVFGRGEAALERVLDEEVDEGDAAARIGREAHRRRPAVEQREDGVLLGRLEPHERLPVHGARGLVHPAKRLAIDGAEARERPEDGVVEVGAGDLRRPEELRAPAHLLHARRRDEVPEGVLRPPARGRAVVVVGERVAVAEWAAGEEERHAVVEGGQHALDVVGRAQRARPGVVVGGNHAVAERRERRELVPGEEAAARRRVRPAHAGHGRRQRGEQGAEALQELAAAEEQRGRGRRLGRGRLCGAVAERFGRIDVLINNAAIFFGIDNQDTSYAYLRKIFDVNYFGAWLMCRAVFPHMRDGGGGSIINQSSGAAYMHPEYPIEGELPSFHYSVTKAAMNAMTHYMAGSVGRYNIRVNAIAPGPTMTEATRQGVPAHFLDLIINFQMAIHRALDPDDLTGTAVWLASDDAKMVTGQVIPVDGGMIMRG